MVYGAKLKVDEGDPVQMGQEMVEWDPYTFAILTEIGGTVQFKDLQEGVTLHEEVDEVTGLSRRVVADSPDEKRQPQIVINGKKGSKRYLMPSRAHLMVQEGDEVFPGDVLAKIPRETTKTKDITGGLPRVVELFEARKPHEPAVITEIDGIGEIRRGRQGPTQESRGGGQGHETRNIPLPRGVHVSVQEGERVKAGEPLMDGPLNPHDILAVLGEKELQKLSGERNPGSLPVAGRQYQRQAHRGDRSPDDALGESGRSGRYGVPAGRAGGQVRLLARRTNA